MKPLIMGEGPSRSGDRYHQFPLSGQVGRRLCTWAGIEPLERDRSMSSEYARWYWALREEFDLANFYERWPQEWTPRESQAHLKAVWLEERFEELYGRVVVLLGVRVQTVFRLDGLVRPGGFFTWDEHPGVRLVTVTVPHPSGLNRVYNEELMKRKTGEVLREAIERAKTHP